MLTRTATLEPSSANDETRTCECVWSTGAPVRRKDRVGEFTERLSLDPAHVDCSRLVASPLLNAHRQDSLDNVIGVVTAAKVDGHVGTATLKFSERAEGIWKDVKAGILRAVSVGYSVAKWEDRSVAGRREKTAIRWTPRELSLVAIGADPDAAIRKKEAMDEDESTTPDRATVNAEIRKLAKAAGLDHAVADSLIDREASVDEARAELFDAVLAKPAPAIRSQRIEVGDTLDAPEKIVERMSEALTCRLDGKAPSDAARPYMHRRLVDYAAELLEARGERTRLLSPDSILTRAMHTTGDFPTLLTSTGNRILLAAFTAAPNPLRSLARQTTITDFRTKTTVKLSEWPKLSQVNEHGEITYGTRGEAKEAYALKTYAKIFSLSRQALVNDDLGAFADFGRAAGRAAAETEADVLTALLTANTGTGVTLDDGNPLFHSTHGNVAGAGTVIDATNLAAARVAMRSQKGLDGVTPVNAVPTYLLVSPTKEFSAEQILATIAPATSATSNPFSGKLTLLVEPRLTGNRWWLFADPAVMPVLEYAYLSSAQGPQMASREGWDVLGMEFRVVLDFGAGVVDHRGAYTNAGA